MKLQEFKTHLSQIQELDFMLPSGEKVPNHYHLTEIGQTEKKFIDCGGTLRTERKISMQLWTAEDFDHRLKAQKFLGIIDLAEDKLDLEDLDIQIEYQDETKGLYHLNFDGELFNLIPIQTDCLAKETCGIPVEKGELSMSELAKNIESSCKPGGGCC